MKMLTQKNGYLVTLTILSLLLLFALLTSSCGKKSASKNEAPHEKIVSTPVYTMVVHTTDFDNRFEVSAKVAPVQEAFLSAESSGQVLAAPFEANQDIQKGAILLRIDASVPASQINLLKSSLKQAQREYDRTQKLAGEGLATPQQLDQLSSQVERANLAIQQANIALSKSILRSPISGYVVQKLVEKGEFIAAGHPVARIIDYDTVKIFASVPESEISYVKEGENVDVNIPALNKNFTGTVYRRSVMANERSRTFDVEIRIPNKTHEILPGMRAKVLIPRDILKNVTVVPQSAILQGFNHTEAMVLPGTSVIGKAERRIVELGPTKDDKVVVLQGLRDGDRLIYKGHRGIINGTLVEDHSAQAKKDSSSDAPSNPQNQNNKAAKNNDDQSSQKS